MLERKTKVPENSLRADIHAAYRTPEIDSVTVLIEHAEIDPERVESAQMRALKWVEVARAAQQKTTGVDSFLTEYALSSDEGIALMCLAEALLRVPDQKTVDKLIKDKLTSVDWITHQTQSDSFFVHATTWGLMITGYILNPEGARSVLGRGLMHLVSRSSEIFIRKAVEAAMRVMSQHFVMGRTIEEALVRAKKKEAVGYRYSYDMLGEAALTAQDAAYYFDAYAHAITAIGATVSQKTSDQKSLDQKPGISIKLSALHPRFQEAQSDRVLLELTPKLLALAQLAKQLDLALMVDAEESERLDLSLDVFARVFNDETLSGWHGFGLAVQSYQKRAFYILDWVAALARGKQRRIMVRLMKGAYWDSEIKKTQVQGLSDYPVFTQKVFTDVSFQACAKKLLTMTDAIYPQFATHNAYSVALILSLVGEYRDFEFQCLHGMGDALYEQIVPPHQEGIPCRIYAPVGSHKDLLPYLVRRLLENGANASFVNRIMDKTVPVSSLIADPVAKARRMLSKINVNIPLPATIFLPARLNSTGIDWSDRVVVARLQRELADIKPVLWRASPRLAGKKKPANPTRVVYAPQASNRPIGSVMDASADDIEWALAQATIAFTAWGRTSVFERAACLRRFADLLESHQAMLLAMACLEAGKTMPDAAAEIREAVDFCRYYADEAEKSMADPRYLQGYTGERNVLSLHPRGVVLCISPWNFPLAIFTGQVVAALVTGNCVIAKPAEQTPLMACYVVDLMLQAGVPDGVIQLLPGPGEVVGAAVVSDARIHAVIFTGSTQTAALINQALAMRGGPIIPLIAETGGQNAMIVDSSALLDQVVIDVMVSAFGSAGQRCSALRVLYIQEEVYPRMLELLVGAMAELDVGDPCWLSTDVGPVIDETALDVLREHVLHMQEHVLYTCNLKAACVDGYFMPPTLIAINSMDALKHEVFGPVLHVMRFKQNQLDDVIHQINSTHYGLTLGIQSRIHQTVEYIRQRVRVGNCYVNRSMIGAVVGLQPFGGEGLSGTGPKAGGPYYLQRLCHERIYTVDTTAAGGNASLMALPEEIEDAY